MTDLGKLDVLGVKVDAVDYAGALRRIGAAAKEGRPCAVSALAVHGVMTGRSDREHRVRLNSLDLVVPDGQPVRWAMNLLHGAGLKERVYGPRLMLEVCRWAEREGVGVYLYGSTPAVLERLRESLGRRFPRLEVSGAEPSRFRQLGGREKAELARRIRSSGAGITLVGLGCPRQEVWAYEYREVLSMPILAVGAAFDFHAGNLAQAPGWMQRRGLEWLFRLKKEPRRLWRRYLLLNPAYLALLAGQLLGLGGSSRGEPEPVPREISYG